MLRVGTSQHVPVCVEAAHDVLEEAQYVACIRMVRLQLFSGGERVFVVRVEVCDAVLA